jgi:DNA repair protein RadC
MTVHTEKHKKIKLTTSEEVFKVMHQLLMSEEENDISREHFWVISLFHNYKIMNIELISLGNKYHTIVDPMEAFSVPFQKKAAMVILVHNHPSGELIPSLDDKDITDKLIACGKVINCPVVEHLIISTENYFSFAKSGLLAELEKSTKYGVDLTAEKYKHWKRIERTHIAEKMIMIPKLDLKEIKAITGLTIDQLEKMKKDLFTKKKK